jgi:hypothetical protein
MDARINGLDCDLLVGAAVLATVAAATVLATVAAATVAAATVAAAAEPGTCSGGAWWHPAYRFWCLQHSSVQWLHILCRRTNLRKHVLLLYQSIRHQLPVLHC